MPRKSNVAPYEDRLTEAVADDIRLSADTIASNQGPPPNTRRTSDARKLTLWGLADPGVDHAQMVQTLMTTGVPSEQMQTLRLAQFSKSHPDLIMAYGQPVADPALAERLATIAEYPYRLAVYDGLEPKERVTEAERLTRAWEQTQGIAVDTSEDAAPPAPPATNGDAGTEQGGY